MKEEEREKEREINEEIFVSVRWRELQEFLVALLTSPKKIKLPQKTRSTLVACRDVLYLSRRKLNTYKRQKELKPNLSRAQDSWDLFDIYNLSHDNSLFFLFL